ncbi:lycopene cyclase domain-containing protein [Kocuria rhizophila]|uniref:lycopene cyclase domain-containing protein n=1 Tax=Kocuria rhizophila TaxID=72000 RepID=UPI001D3B94BF|nr:lycopene cyclase domain-containing protein [Kocuria rhizophila]MCC5672413.1 lycopene cyclase domain-containing protein [Kocuria rhizophila]
MDHGQYLVLMGMCVAITLPLEFFVGVRVYRRPVRLLKVMVPVIVLFVARDLWGIYRDHWTYNPQFITGIHLGPLPLEELVFFVVIPICGLLTYEAVTKILRLARGTGHLRYRWPDGLVRETPDERHPHA